MKFPVIQGPLASNTAASSVVCFLLFLLLSSASGSQQDGRPVVNLVTMESSGVQDGGMTYHVRFLKPLLDIALEDAHDRFGKYLDIQFKHIETLCGPSEIGALAAKEYYTEKVDVFFGPGRSATSFIDSIETGYFFILLKEVLLTDKYPS